MSVMETSLACSPDVSEDQLPKGGDTAYFSSRPWLASWLLHYRRAGDRYLACPRTLTTSSGDSVSAWLPLMIRDDAVAGIPLRTLRFMGTGDEECEEVATEYPDMVLRPANKEAVASVATLLMQRRDWDMARFDSVLEGSTVAAMLKYMPAYRQLSGWRYRISLDGTFDDWVNRLGRNTRARVRKSLRHLEQGRLALDWYAGTTDFTDALERLARLHRLRWLEKGKAGVFDASRFMAFHHSLLDRPDHAARIVVLREGERDIAAWYGFDHDGTRYFYQSGIVPSLPGLSPGLAIHAVVIRDAFVRGLEFYDFMQGSAQSYKQRYATQRSPVFHYMIPGHTLRGRIVAMALRRSDRWQKAEG